MSNFDRSEKTNKQTKSAKLKSDTYFWCVNKNNLVSTRDEGSGNEDKDGKGYPGLIKKKKLQISLGVLMSSMFGLAAVVL